MRDNFLYIFGQYISIAGFLKGNQSSEVGLRHFSAQVFRINESTEN